MTKQTHSVILGAGPMGRAIADTLVSKGQAVTVVTRNGRDIGPGITARKADLSNADQTTAACQGAGAIYQCAAPPITSGMSASRPCKRRPSPPPRTQGRS